MTGGDKGTLDRGPAIMIRFIAGKLFPLLSLLLDAIIKMGLVCARRRYYLRLLCERKTGREDRLGWEREKEAAIIGEK